MAKSGCTPVFARVARAQTLSERSRDYVLAARSVGAAAPRILIRHILPNSLAPLVTQFALTFTASILIAAALSFLGLGERRVGERVDELGDDEDGTAWGPRSGEHLHEVQDHPGDQDDPVQPQDGGKNLPDGAHRVIPLAASSIRSGGRAGGRSAFRTA